MISGRPAVEKPVKRGASKLALAAFAKGHYRGPFRKYTWPYQGFLRDQR